MRFKDLEAIAKSIEASGEKSEAGLSARQEILELFYELSVLTFQYVPDCPKTLGSLPPANQRRQMANGAEQQREKTYLESAVSRLSESKFLSDLGLGKLMIMKAAISVLADSPALKHASLDMSEVSTTLAKAVLTNTNQVYSEWSKSPGEELLQDANLLVLLANIGVADVLGPTALKGFRDLVPQLAATSRRLTDEGAKAGWDMQIFLAKHFGQLASPSLHIQLPDAGSLQSSTSEATNPSATGLPAVDRNSILEYLDVVSRSLDEDGRLAELQALLARTQTTSSPTGQLVGIYQLVQHIKGLFTSLISSLLPLTRHRRLTVIPRQPSYRRCLQGHVRSRQSPQLALPKTRRSRVDHRVPPGGRDHPLAPRRASCVDDAVEHRAHPEHGDGPLRGPRTRIIGGRVPPCVRMAQPARRRGHQAAPETPRRALPPPHLHALRRASGTHHAAVPRRRLGHRQGCRPGPRPHRVPALGAARAALRAPADAGVRAERRVGDVVARGPQRARLGPRSRQALRRPVHVPGAPALRAAAAGARGAARGARGARAGRLRRARRHAAPEPAHHERRHGRQRTRRHEGAVPAAPEVWQVEWYIERRREPCEPHRDV